MVRLSGSKTCATDGDYALVTLIDGECTVHVFKSIHAHLGYYLCFNSLVHETKQLFNWTNLYSANEFVEL
jgi:hypothetical protein